MSSYRAKIGFDYSHNNKLTLEASSYSDFFQFLFASGYKVGKIQAGFTSLTKMKEYDAIILSTPRNTMLNNEEIENVIKYVKKGGSLLVISSMGGDLKNRTNLNEVTENFGFEFNSDEINDSMNYAMLQKRPLISKFTPHIVTEQIENVVFSSACSMNILDNVDEIKEIQIEELVVSGLNSWRRIYDGEDWEEQDFPKATLMISVKFYEGKIIAFGGLSLFSSLGREYGFYAYDNDILIGNMLKWLTMDIESSKGEVITINLNKELYYWAEKVVKEYNWENLSNLINVGMKNFKDNYDDIMEEIIEEKEKRKIKRKESTKKEEKEEDKVYELIPERKKEDLVDIISSIEELTGEKFEYTIDLDDLEDESEEKNQKERENKQKNSKKNQKKKEVILFLRNLNCSFFLPIFNFSRNK
jgi:hypothetical protein